ncbi:MAG: ABC transporter permease [Clostridia bacterium]|nr:ABC transporter permease [Clostridia bacterium]
MSFSDMFVQLWTTGTLPRAIWETVYMTFLSTAAAYAIGIPLGVLLCVTEKGGLRPIPWLNRILSLIINLFRSVPFIILMVTMLPVAKWTVGTTTGPAAMIVMLVIAAAPYVARMVEGAVKEVDPGVIEAAKSMGSGNFRIVTKVLLPEARPSLINGAIISLVTVLSYSAMASTINGGGLGQIAILYGHQRFNDDVTWVCCLLLVLIVQIIQEIGLRVARRSDKRKK